ncbi:HesA/MoeB/ThiF family protein [Pleomorphovibrio marinus]|uniref:HesA/MoeB/ThiF family protein n=1 Tax=Pleomorphovibrio marinus TaxID=2164132 RepID=UPI000E0A78E9|nr:HesA/MoeB/ThiF family protein [Pleomorphovibrio marinus]
MNRYLRQIQVPEFGKEGQEKLNKAKVLVVGAGGLGVPVLQYLTGMGIGTIGIVDGDRIEETNLHRQVIYSPSDVGKMKVEVCKVKLSLQNPEMNLQTYPSFLNKENALTLIGKYDLVVDATDNFATRYLINDACVLLKKPFIYGALQFFEGHVSVFNYQNGPTYRCLYPNPPDPGQVPDCNQAGVLGIVPGIIGSFQALEALKVISGIGEPLSGQLLVMDLLGQSQYKIKLKPNPSYTNLHTLADTYEVPLCQTETSPTLSVEEWMNWDKEHVLIDVRETHEYKAGHVPQAVSWPLSKIQGKLPDLPKGKPWILMCQMGGRSQKAIHYLKESHPELELFNLEGGYGRWKQVAKQTSET